MPQKPGDDPSSGISSGDALIRPSGIRHIDGAKLDQAFVRNVKPVLRHGANRRREGTSRKRLQPRGRETDAERRDGAARSSDEGSVMEPERRGCVVQP